MKNLGTALAVKKQEACEHMSSITVRSGGIHRLICETCGHVSFEFAENTLSEVERDRFARSIDQIADAS